MRDLVIVMTKLTFETMTTTLIETILFRQRLEKRYKQSSLINLGLRDSFSQH